MGSCCGVVINIAVINNNDLTVAQHQHPTVSTSHQQPLTESPLLRAKCSVRQQELRAICAVVVYV